MVPSWRTAAKTTSRSCCISCDAYASLGTLPGRWQNFLGQKAPSKLDHPKNYWWKYRGILKTLEKKLVVAQKKINEGRRIGCIWIRPPSPQMQPERTALLLTAANTMSPQNRPRNWCPKIWIISSMAVSSSWPGIFTVSENIPSPSHDIYHHISSFKHLHFPLWVKGKSQLNDQPRERHLGRTVFLRLMISTVSGSFFLEDVSLSCFLYANLCRHISDGVSRKK